MGNESERRAYYAGERLDGNIARNLGDYCSPSGLEPTVKDLWDPLQNTLAFL